MLEFNYDIRMSWSEIYHCHWFCAMKIRYVTNVYIHVYTHAVNGKNGMVGWKNIDVANTCDRQP